MFGFEPDYTPFDAQIVAYINSAFLTLRQIGVGPLEGFLIEDSVPTWAEYLYDNANLISVQTFVYLNVKLLFDPPTYLFVLESMKKQIEELTWRLNVKDSI